MKGWLFIVFVACFFFLFVPGIGAFVVRKQWRGFRKRLSEFSMFRILHQHLPFDIQSQVSDSPIFVGEYRFFGTLEAIQKLNTIWLKNKNISVSVAMKMVNIYVLPGAEGEIPSHEMPQRLRWEELTSIPEGSKVFVAGDLFWHNDRFIFSNTKKNKLVVIFYEGSDDSVLKRGIYSGRQKNEYWNPITPVSLAAGFIILLMLGYAYLQSPMNNLSGILALGLAFSPLTPFFPPGIVFFYFYRRFWNAARELRADRDLLRLPLRFQTSERNADWISYYGVPETYERCLGKVDKGLRFRVPGRIDFDETGDYQVFSERDQQGNEMDPSDPMAEYVALPGNTYEVSLACAKKGHIFELLSALLLTSCIGVNLIIVFYLMGRLIQ